MPSDGARGGGPGRALDPRLLTALDKVLDDVIEVLEEHDWPDEAAWYAEIRAALLASDPDSPTFRELLAELEQSFLGLGTFTDIPLIPRLVEATDALTAQDTHHQRLGLASCASGIIQRIKRARR